MPHAIPISEKTREIAVNAVLSAPDGHVATISRRYTLINLSVRERACAVVRKVPIGWVLRLTKRNRTKEQNDKMWAMLTDLSVQKPEGRKCTPDDWKCLAMNACNHDVIFMEGLDGKPFPVGFKSSQLSIREMSTLIEWIYAYGAEHNIKWSEPKQ